MALQADILAMHVLPRLRRQDVHTLALVNKEWREVIHQLAADFKVQHPLPRVLIALGAHLKVRACVHVTVRIFLQAPTRGTTQGLPSHLMSQVLDVASLVALLHSPLPASKPPLPECTLDQAHSSKWLTSLAVQDKEGYWYDCSAGRLQLYLHCTR